MAKAEGQAVIFARQFIRPILSGKKTQARRPILDTRPCRQSPGHTYAVQAPRVIDGKRTVETLAHIQVTDIRDELLADISPADALAEGFRSRGEFFDWWREQHGTGPLMEVPVHVVVFELEREERPVFLGQHGYTSSVSQALGATTASTRDQRGRPLEPEPQTVDALTLARFARENRERFQDPERERRESRARAARLREVETRARHRGLDIEEELASIDATLEEIRRRYEAAA